MLLAVLLSKSTANCSQGKVATYFEPGATVDFNTGRLLNQDATGAKTLTFNF